MGSDLATGHCWCGQPHRIQHGTITGYRRHLKLRRGGHQGVEPCEPCTVASNVYMRNWRAEHPESHQRAIDRQACRDRAMRRLAQEYEARLKVLYRDELAKAGLTRGRSQPAAVAA